MQIVQEGVEALLHVADGADVHPDNPALVFQREGDSFLLFCQLQDVSEAPLVKRPLRLSQADSGLQGSSFGGAPFEDQPLDEHALLLRLDELPVRLVQARPDRLAYLADGVE